MPLFFSLWRFRSCEYELQFQANWPSQMMKSGAKHSPSFCNSRRPFGSVSKFWRVGGLQVSKFKNLKELQMSSETSSRCHFSLAYDASDPVSMSLNSKRTGFRRWWKVVQRTLLLFATRGGPLGAFRSFDELVVFRCEIREFEGIAHVEWDKQ